MPARSRSASVDRLRASPAFALAFALDGRPYVAKDAEPYVQYWLSERYRVLHALFSARRGTRIDDAIADYLRLTREADTPARRAALRRAIDDMRGAGVLIGSDDDVSRYDARMVEAYVTHRPFPAEIVAHVVRAAGIGSASRVLDLAGGPGDLALALARTSRDVTLMELSRGFVRAAARRARAAGLPLTTLHESCNRIVHMDDAFDAITVSQALHWLDDVLVCRGVCRVLRPGGSFLVIHSAIDLPDRHPLAFVLGHDSVLGAKRRESFVDELKPMQRRLTLLFEALDAPAVERVDPTQRRDGAARIVPAGAALFRQSRPYGLGYARAFLTPQHIAASGLSPEAFWRRIEDSCTGVDAGGLMGIHHWAVLQFRRGGAADATPLDALQPRDIAYPAMDQR